MKSRLLLALTFAALSVLTSAAFAEELTPPADRPPAAAFRLDNLVGESVSLQDFAGQVVVISFWATWCGPCLQEIPFMNGFFEQYGDQGLTVLAVTTDGPETLSEVRNVARRGHWTLPVLLDLDGAVAAQLNPRGTQPFTMFIDRAGRVAATHEGFSSGDEVEHEATIQALLAESP
ncbi:MAG: TlpA family protein disulfide reductase [Myxococcales bacterium]|nr:TlpA family protein disulfide reductase [Myxococcales bacterium]MCB9533251.1 TlpA family protein disulfide reductase [Myxococcales bacterium]